MHVIDINASIGRRVSGDARYGARSLAGELDRHRVACAVVHHEEAVHYRMDEGNRLAGEAAADRRFIAAAVLDLRDSLRLTAEIDRCLAAGVRVFRFFPVQHEYSFRGRLFAEVIDRLAGSGSIVMAPALDCSQEGGSLEALAGITRRAGLPVVLTELPYLFLSEVIAVMRVHSNVHAETNWLATVGTVETMVDAVGSERLVYGSAAPHRPMQKSLNQVLEADIAERDKAAILGGNAMRLLRLDAGALAGLSELASLEPAGFAEPIVDVHSHLGYWPIPMPNEDYDPSRMIERMRRFGVTRSVVSSYESMRYDVAAGNARLARAIGGHPELLGCVELDPHDLESSCREMDRYLKLPNFVGVELELTHIPAPTGSEKVRRLMAEVAKRGRPVLLKPHADGDARAERELARRFPRLPIVHAHAFDAEWAEVVKDAPNVSVEFCLSRPSHHDVRDVLDILGPRRVLFGSDQTLLSLGAAVGLYLDARMSDEERTLVLSGNARRIYGLTEQNP